MAPAKSTQRIKKYRSAPF